LLLLLLLLLFAFHHSLVIVDDQYQASTAHEYLIHFLHALLVANNQWQGRFSLGNPEFFDDRPEVEGGFTSVCHVGDAVHPAMMFKAMMLHYCTNTATSTTLVIFAMVTLACNQTLLLTTNYYPLALVRSNKVN